MRIEFNAMNAKKSSRRKLREEVCKLRTGTLSFPASTLTTLDGITHSLPGWAHKFTLIIALPEKSLGILARTKQNNSGGC